jgi:dolichol-phosphate mannosyltransferase
MSRTLVVIPTYDEAANVLIVLDRVLAAVPGAHVLVVDDNSPDGTADLVERRTDWGTGVFVLRRKQKAGLGAAYRAGFTWALDRGYDVVVQMDADLSHPPEKVPELVAALATADVAVGSRYVPGGSVQDWSWARRMISRGGNSYVRLVLGLPVHDTTAGFKAFRAAALRTIGATASDSDGYCFQIENTWQAVRRGLVVAEVPISFTDRVAGSSKMSSAIVGEALGRVLLWRLAELLPGGARRTAQRSSRSVAASSAQ